MMIKVLDIRDKERDDGGGNQDVDEDAGELPQEDDEPAGLLFKEHVPAIRTEACPGLAIR